MTNSTSKNVTEGSLRKSIVEGRRLARREFARVLRMVHRDQQHENENCGAHGPASVVHEFPYGSREGKAIGGMRGYEVLRRRLFIVDDDERGVVIVRAWS